MVIRLDLDSFGFHWQFSTKMKTLYYITMCVVRADEGIHNLGTKNNEANGISSMNLYLNRIPDNGL